MAVKTATHARASTPEPSPARASTLEAVAVPDVDDSSVRSEGQARLIQLPGSLAQIGERVGGATRQAVALWRNGTRIPELRWRKGFDAAYNIPIEAWDHAPGPLPATSSSPSAGGELAGADDDDAEQPTLLEDCLRRLKSLRREMAKTNLLTRERLLLDDAFAKALAARAKYERDAELLEDRIVRAHPKWKRMKAAIMAALIKHPAAARDVEAALIELMEDGDEDESEIDP